MNREPLTLDQIRALAPSAFAITKHDSRSDRYAYIPTIEVVNALMSNGFLCYSAQQTRTSDATRSQYCKHMLRFRREGWNPTVLPNTHERCSITFPEVLVTNGHDGSAAFSERLGFREQICWNGLVVDRGTCAEIKIKHVGQIDAQAVEGAELLIADSARVLDRVVEWTQMQMTAAEELNFATLAHKARFADMHNDTTTAVADLLLRRRPQDAGHDLWTVFNVVEENAIQGGLVARKPDVYGENGEFIRRGRQTKTRPVTSIATDLLVNEALWSIAEDFAAGKHN